MNAVTPTDYRGGSPFYDVFNKGINEMSDFFANAGIPGIGNGEETIPPPQVIFNIPSQKERCNLDVGTSFPGLC